MTMKIGLLLHDLHRRENELARDLLQISERHAADHEIHHLARDLATWCRRHVTALADAAPRYELKLDPEPHTDTTRRPREKTEDLLARQDDAALLLLHDLRRVYIDASAISLDWELVGQAAQALKDEALLHLVDRCHPDTLRQIRWANAKLKEAGPQALTT
jgi:hypothetical protein